MTDPEGPKSNNIDTDAEMVASTVPKAVPTDVPAQSIEALGKENGSSERRETARISERKDVSSQISTLVRYIAFGLVAVTYSLFTSTAEFSIKMLEEHRTVLLYASSAGGVTILLDYLQYAFGYRAVNKALGRDNKKYKEKWLSYKGWSFFFIAKQATVAIGLTLFCVAMLQSALSGKSEIVQPPVVTVPSPECKPEPDIESTKVDPTEG